MDTPHMLQFTSCNGTPLFINVTGDGIFPSLARHINKFILGVTILFHQKSFHVMVSPPSQ
ncbi:hypothetical protein Hanom_Chr15g01364201 [Helianthus anomalus]